MARSAPECRLYIELHPCSCGETGLDVRHTLRTGADGGLDAVYEGTCGRCGLPRRFVFALDPATPPPPPAYGGPSPSRIICPGQFALVADEAARSAAADPTRLAESARARSREALTRAVAAQQEILKFIPDGSGAVPTDAFTSPEGKTRYAREPGRFERRRLEAVVSAYQDALAAYERPARTVVRLARSSEEAHLYMDLHPCPTCGQARFARDSVLLEGEGGLQRRYAGVCSECGGAREFVFRMPADPVPAATSGQVRFGDDRPSELLDAGEWMWVADRHAQRHPADPAQLGPDELPRARADLAYALAALDEVAKFVPSGGDAVPRSAIWTDRGRQEYAREPYRFRLRLVDAVRETYCELLGRLV